MTNKKTYGQSIIRLVLITAGILFIPLIAMQFTNDVAWTLHDFIFAGILIFGTGFAYKLITGKTEELVYRIAVGVACATGFLLVWVNGAVGIIGSVANPINVWFYGVPLLGLIGAFISRLQPKGMTLTLFATASTHALIAVIALVGGRFQSPPVSAAEIIGLNGFFLVLWSTSALIFNYVSEHNSESELNAV